MERIILFFPKSSDLASRNLERDFPLEGPLKDLASSKQVFSPSDRQRRLPNITGSEFTADKVDYGEMPEMLLREVPPSYLNDPFVADDTFQDQGPGSVEIYKLDLFKEKALFTATTPSASLPARNKSKAPKKTGRTKAKSTEIKSTSPKTTRHRQSNFFEEQRTETPINRDTFDVGGVPELQVGCEGLEASSHKARRRRSIGTSDKEEGKVPAAWPDVTPITLDLDYDLSYDEEDYEEMDELLKLKRLEEETTTKRVKPNRGDMDATLNSAQPDDSGRPEKLPVRGDLGDSTAVNTSGLAVSPPRAKIGRDETPKTLMDPATRYENAEAETKRQAVSSDDDGFGGSRGRRLLWLAEPNTEGFADDERKRARRSIDWGFGEDEGVVVSNELQTVNERRRQHDMRHHKNARRHDQQRAMDSDVDGIRREYERMLEQKRREEDERLQQAVRKSASEWQEEEEKRRNEMRRRQYEEYRRTTGIYSRDDEEARRRETEERREQEAARNRTRETARRNEEEEERRRRLQEERLRERNRWQEEERGRKQEENARPRTPADDDERRRRPTYDEETRRAEERRRQEDERKRLQDAETKRQEQYRWQQEAEKRRQEEERRRTNQRDPATRNLSETDRRRLEERRKEWLEKRRQEDEERRRQQQQQQQDRDRNEAPSSLTRAGHRVDRPNTLEQPDRQDQGRRMREQEERAREQKLREYIARNRPIHVNQTTDRRWEEERRRYRPTEQSAVSRPNVSRDDEEYRRRAEEHRRRQEEERKLQDYIRSNQPVNVPSRDDQSSTGRNLLDERRAIEEARQRGRYHDPGAARRRGPSQPTYIDPRSPAEQVRRKQEEARRLEEERRRATERQQRYEAEERRKELARRQQAEGKERQQQQEEEWRKEAARREEETRRVQSRKYEEDRKRLEAARIQAERRRQEVLRERARDGGRTAGRTRQPEATRPPSPYQDSRILLEHRRRQDSRPIPSNLAWEEARRAATERERQRQEERARQEAARQEGSR